MLYTKTLEYMATLIHKKGYYTFCQVPDDEIQKINAVFEKENKDFIIKGKKAIKFKEKEISIFQALQSIFQEAVAFVAHETNQQGNGGWDG